MSKSLIFAHFLFFGERCERFAHDCSFPLSDVSESLRSLTKNEWCDRIAQVAHQKMSDVSESLRGNEQKWAFRSFFNKNFLNRIYVLEKKNIILLDLNQLKS